ncbi:hypothetical protein Alsa3_CDS0144 [Staphylococcus phage Alsa_3]|nr:hypothetical protein Alsa3_CDS0144 [Staphylococcus phage Alsa_3]
MFCYPLHLLIIKYSPVNCKCFFLIFLIFFNCFYCPFNSFIYVVALEHYTTTKPFSSIFSESVELVYFVIVP